MDGNRLGRNRKEQKAVEGDGPRGDPKPTLRRTKGCKRMSTGQSKEMNQVLETATFSAKMCFFHTRLASCIEIKL